MKNVNRESYEGRKILSWWVIRKFCLERCIGSIFSNYYYINREKHLGIECQDEKTYEKVPLNLRFILALYGCGWKNTPNDLYGIENFK